MKQERKETFSKLAKAIKGMTENDKMTFVAERSVINTEGKSLSLNNAILMIMQRPDSIPTVVGGYRQWQTAGRQVQKGEHGMMIWYPSKRKQKENEPEESTRFFIGTVFDILQTKEIEEIVSE